MDNIIPTNEYTEVEGRVYANPQVSLDRSNAFIDNLRATQAQQNQQITTDTQRLGTDVPTNLGGLTGGEGYFTSRYQTPQTNSAVNQLRSAALLAAANQAMQNEVDIWKKRQQDAYRAYQKRQYDASKTTGGNGNGGLDVDTNADTQETVEVSTYQPGSGQIIPNTDYVSDYQDAETGQWYQLTSPREIDVTAAQNTLAGRAPSDGQTVTVNGKTLRYVAATDSWYEQTNSAGPDTYSPRAR